MLSWVELREGSQASEGLWEGEDLERPGRRHLDFLSLVGSMVWRWRGEGGREGGVKAMGCTSWRRRE